MTSCDGEVYKHVIKRSASQRLWKGNISFELMINIQCTDTDIILSTLRRFKEVGLLPEPRLVVSWGVS